MIVLYCGVCAWPIDHWLHKPRQDCERCGARVQQTGDRGGGAINPRRPVRHPLLGEEEVRRFIYSFLFVCFSLFPKSGLLEVNGERNSIPMFVLLYDVFYHAILCWLC